MKEILKEKILLLFILSITSSYGNEKTCPNSFLLERKKQEAHAFLLRNATDMLVFSSVTGAITTTATRREIENALRKAGIHNDKDLANKTREELLNIQGIYPPYVDGIEAILKTRGLSLKKQIL